MDAEHIANAIIAAETSELGNDIKAEAAHYVGSPSVAGRCVVNGINIAMSSSFDEDIASSKGGAAIFKNITPNQIGLEIPATGMLRGKSGILAREIIRRVEAFGQTVKSNQNAAIVQVNEASYFVANTGTGVYVVYGYLDNSQIDLDQYTNIVDRNDAPVLRYEERDLFENILEDAYEIGGAFEME